MLINKNNISQGSPCFIIAEAGVNHNGDIKKAKKLIDLAHDAGADAIKFQSFNSEKLVAPSCRKAEYQVNEKNNESHLAMLRKFQLTKNETKKLFNYCKNKDIIFLSTPYDEENIDFLEKLNVPAFKVSSPDIVNVPLIRSIGKKGKPVIISTGTAELDEINFAVDIIEKTGNTSIIILHCISAYPTMISDVNLNVIRALIDLYDYPIGFSDHTMDIEISLAAVAMGACVIEKHFTLDKNDDGPDHASSLDPNELFNLVRYIRNIEKAKGDSKKVLTAEVLKNKEIGERKVFFIKDLNKGKIIKHEDITGLRNDIGVSIKYYDSIVGKKIKTEVKSGDLLRKEWI